MIVLVADIILTAILIHIVLVMSSCTTSHCHLESCTNNPMKHVNLFATTYLRLSMQPVSSSPPSSSTSSSSCRFVQFSTVCHLESCTNNLMKHIDLSANSYSRLSLQLASSSPPSSWTSYSSCCIVQLPTVCHLESCTYNLT